MCVYVLYIYIYITADNRPCSGGSARGDENDVRTYLRISAECRFAVSKKHLTDADKPSGFYGRPSCFEFQVIPKGLWEFQ